MARLGRVILGAESESGSGERSGRDATEARSERERASASVLMTSAAAEKYVGPRLLYGTGSAPWDEQ